MQDSVCTRRHYDDSVRDPVTGAISEWTLLIYLTGAEDGVEGGNVGILDVVLVAIQLTTDQIDSVLQGTKR